MRRGIGLTRLTGALLLAPALLAASLSAAVARAVELEPVTPWWVDWTKETCILRRGFGSTDDMLVLAFERFSPGPRFQLVAHGSHLRALDRDDRLFIGYGESPPVRPNRFLTGKSGEETPALFVTSSALIPIEEGAEPKPVPPEIEAATTSVTLIWSGRELKLKTGPVDKAFAELRKCTDDLVKTWGLDPVEQNASRNGPTPVGNAARWLNPLDYPRTPLNRGEQAIVNFRLMVDAEGKPTACVVQRSYAGEEFDRVTCDALMRRARFTPALSQAGEPIPSYFVSHVSWIIP